MILTAVARFSGRLFIVISCFAKHLAGDRAKNLAHIHVSRTRTRLVTASAVSQKVEKMGTNTRVA